MDISTNKINVGDEYIMKAVPLGVTARLSREVPLVTPEEFTKKIYDDVMDRLRKRGVIK